MASKPRPSTRSSNPKTTKKRTSGRTGQPPRPQRNNTAEAREQDRRASKTHPTRNIGARRKDKNTGSAAPNPATPPPTPRVQARLGRPGDATRRGTGDRDQSRGGSRAGEQRRGEGGSRA